MNRVRADVQGVGDEPPDVDAEIRGILDQVFTSGETGQEEIPGNVVIGRIRKCLPAVVLLLDALRPGEGGGEPQSDVSIRGSDSDDEERDERLSRRELDQATKALKEMVDAGYVELLRTGSGEEAGIVGRVSAGAVGASAFSRGGGQRAKAAP